MKKLKGILVLVLLLALLASPVSALASDISGAKYYGLIQVSNNGTAVTNVATTCNISTENLINGGYLNSSANNCAIQGSAGADLAFMPGVTDDPWAWSLWVPSIGANSIKTDILYTANTTGGKIRYFPGDTGMTTLDDDPDLELGDNFTITQSGWVDTTYSANMSLVWKEDAFETYVSGTENITSTILGVESSWISPTDFLDEGGWATEPLVYDGNLGTSAVQNISGVDTWGDYLQLFLTSPIDVSGVRYYVDSGIQIININIDLWDGLNWIEVFDGARGADDNWHEKWIGRVINTDTVRVRFQHGDAGADDVEFAEFDFAAILGVTITDVATGEHTITTKSNPPFLGIGEDIGEDTSSPTVTGDMVFNVPLWSSYLSGSPFDSVDANALTCTVTDATWSYETGRDFDGIDDEIQITDDASITDIFDGGGTLIAWINPNSDGEGDNGMIFLKGSGPAVLWFLAVTGEDDGKVDLTFFYTFTGNNGHWVTTSTEVTIGTATQVAVTYNNGAVGNNPLIYVNGDSKAVSEVGAPTVTRDTDVGDAFIGNDLGQDLTFDGTIGEVLLCDEILTPTEITQTFNDTKWKYIGAHTGDNFEYVYSGVGVPDEGSDWSFLLNNVMPYMEYQKIWIDGVLQQHIVWEYDTTFTDLSEQGHDATPSFRTASSDADVSAELISFLPISEAKAPAFVLEEAPAFIEEVPEIVSDFDVSPDPSAGEFPLAGVIATVAAATTRPTPAQLPLVLIAGFTIIGLSLAISGIMRKYGSGTIFVKILITAGLMGIFVALGNFGIDFWMIFVFLIIGVALAMASRHVSWQ